MLIVSLFIIHIQYVLSYLLPAVSSEEECCYDISSKGDFYVVFFSNAVKVCGIISITDANERLAGWYSLQEPFPYASTCPFVVYLYSYRVQAVIICLWRWYCVEERVSPNHMLQFGLKMLAIYSFCLLGKQQNKLQPFDWDSTLYRCFNTKCHRTLYCTEKVLHLFGLMSNWAASCTFVCYIDLFALSRFRMPSPFSSSEFVFLVCHFFSLCSVFSSLCCPTIPQPPKLLLPLNSNPPLVQGRLGCSTTGLFVGLGSDACRPECTCLGFWFWFLVTYLCGC